MKIFSKEESDTHFIYIILGIKIKIKKEDVSNKIFLVDKNGNRKVVKKIEGLKIYFIGQNNTVEIGCDPLPKFVNSCLSVGNNGYVVIGSSKHLIQKFSAYIVNDQEPYTQAKLVIGKNFSINSGYFTTASCSGLSIQIGDDCMFGTGIYIRPTDGHVIFDIEDNRIINYPKNILVGNHVWLAKNVTVLKGSIIPDNTIVGLGGIYTKSTNKIANNGNVILAGNPLSVVRENINWDREDVQGFNLKHLKPLSQ